MKNLLAAAALIAAGAALAQAVPATHSIRVLTPEAAQKAVNAAMAECRKQGFQVAVAVVDRSGVAQAMLRDRFAGRGRRPDDRGRRLHRRRHRRVRRAQRRCRRCLRQGRHRGAARRPGALSRREAARVRSLA